MTIGGFTVGSSMFGWFTGECLRLYSSCPDADKEETARQSPSAALSPYACLPYLHLRAVCYVSY